MDAGKFRVLGIRLGMNSEDHTVERLSYGRMLEGQIPVQDSNTDRAMPLWRIMAKRVPNASSESSGTGHSNRSFFRSTLHYYMASSPAHFIEAMAFHNPAHLLAG
jgi:hypothetical protein